MRAAGWVWMCSLPTSTTPRWTSLPSGTTSIIADRRAEAAGMVSLFAGAEDDLDSEVDKRDKEMRAGPEFEKGTMLRFEKEMLGQYVTDHPLLEIKDELAALSTHRIEELASLGDGDLVTVGGI